MEKISVVIPVYNAQYTIERTVNSILVDNADSNLEIVLVNDGSTDSSLKICKSLSSEVVRVIDNQENSGVGITRNNGILAATGDYIIFMDADDIMPPNSIAALRSGMLSKPDLVVGGYSLVRGNGVCIDMVPPYSKVYRGGELGIFWDDNYTDHYSYLRPIWAKAYKRELLTSFPNLKFSSNIKYGEDLLFLFSFISKCNSIATISTVVYTYIPIIGGLSADLTSERHLSQLLLLIDQYPSIIKELGYHIGESRKFKQIYHNDLCARFVCGALNIMAVKGGPLNNRYNIKKLYSVLEGDNEMSGLRGFFSIRKSQIPNLLLYKCGSPALTQMIYKISSRICRLLRISIPQHKAPRCSGSPE